MRQSRTWRLARVVGSGTAGVAGAASLGAAVLYAQAYWARHEIPRAEAPPPRGGGWYGGKFTGTPITLVMLGDSTAAGYGVDRPRETPGALLAIGISRRLHRPVRLHRLAVVGATSARLAPQAEAALELRPDLAVILIGGNDVTHRTGRELAVGHLVRAVRALRGVGAQVVVGTCPDLGTIRPIRPPLRWLARRWSRQLAADQTIAVVAAGGWTVSLGDLLGPRFLAEPHRMFGQDRFHPSAEGYAAAASALLPTAIAALGGPDRTAPSYRTGLRPLADAAAEASRRAGTEVSAAPAGGPKLGGQDRGRWAALRTRVRQVVRPGEGTGRRPATVDPAPQESGS